MSFFILQLLYNAQCTWLLVKFPIMPDFQQTLGPRTSGFPAVHYSPEFAPTIH